MFDAFAEHARSKPAQEIHKLAARRAELRADERALNIERQEAERELQDARRALQEAEARGLALGGHVAQTKAARKRVADAEHSLPDVNQRLERVAGALAVIDA